MERLGTWWVDLLGATLEVWLCRLDDGSTCCTLEVGERCVTVIGPEDGGWWLMVAEDGRDEAWKDYPKALTSEALSKAVGWVVSKEGE